MKSYLEMTKDELTAEIAVLKKEYKRFQKSKIAIMI